MTRNHERVLTLYDNVASSNALKVRFLLGELGLEYRSVEIDLSDPRPGWYLEIHPWGLVPCLVDGELVIPESNTALRYLADREARADLYPADAALRARIDLVMDALSLQLRPALWEVEKSVVYGGPESGEAVAELEAALAAWESLLDPGGWCVAGRFSIADCAAAGRLVHLDRLPVDHHSFPRTMAMLTSARGRAPYADALAT